MGLRCLIGHDYTSPETEREREERGGEEIVTIREFKECRRCGDRQIITENKEVRSTDDGSSAEPSGPATEPNLAGEEADGPDAGGEYEEVTAEDDDGVILSEDDSEGRSRGEWPGEEDDDEEPSEDAEGEDEEDGEDTHEWPEREEPAGEEMVETTHEWPDTHGEDEGFDAVTGGDDDSVEDVEFGGGLTPERSGAEAEATAGASATVNAAEEAADDATDETPAGIRSADPSPSPTGPQRSATGVATILECPECDHVADDGASLRPGDICPECRRGYLTEREE